MKDLCRNALTLIVAVLLFLLAAEMVLRLLPVDEALLAEPVNSTNPVFHFRPNQNLTWSRGLTFDLVNRIRVNAAGYVNEKDYSPANGRSIIAVVGDSQVEAAMVPYSKTHHARIAELTGKDVYSFGASGAPLSQYLIWARQARQRWNVEFLIITVVGNDFDESLFKNNSRPGFHYYDENSAGKLVLRRIDYVPNPMRSVVKWSALARYLLFNGQILTRLKQISSAYVNSATAEESGYAGNTSVSTDFERVAASKRAVRAFLNDLQSLAGWPPDRVLFLVDGFRYPSEKEAHGNSYFGQMRRDFLNEARAEKFAAIDMDDVFFEDFVAAGLPFEYPNDGHWNVRAHELAARAATDSQALMKWMDHRVQ